MHGWGRSVPDQGTGSAHPIRGYDFSDPAGALGQRAETRLTPPDTAEPDPVDTGVGSEDRE
ncbi:hypothetical protein GCM10022230_15500 [Pseudoclavibacter caeni]